jgi:hypothetical protein
MLRHATAPSESVEKIATITGLADESVCPTPVHKGLL